MGIRGLRSFIMSRLGIPAIRIPSGSTLVIDGDGWIFYLMRECPNLCSELGGNYSSLKATILDEINFLKSCGFKLLVLFDGLSNPLKGQTASERMQRRQQQLVQLAEVCSESAPSSTKRDLPMPPLCKLQLLATLLSEGIQIIDCHVEADPEIARFVHYENSSVGQTKFFAYAQDSDYYAMKDCPYIEFGTITKSGGVASAPVWTRSMCCGLSLSEDRFVEFLLFIGNDYTAALMAQTDMYKELYTECSYNIYQLMYKWLNVYGTGRRLPYRLFKPLPPDHAPEDKTQRDTLVSDIQIALDYSRALYNLQPLVSFHVEAAKRAEQAELEELAEPAELAALAGLPGLEEHPASIEPLNNDVYHFSDTTEFSIAADMGSTYWDEVMETGTEGVERGVAAHALTFLQRKNATAAFVTAEHVEAIKTMLEKLGRAQTRVRCADVPRAVWEDAQAALVYQRTCAILLKALPKNTFTGVHNTPARLFDGVMFHTTLREMRHGVMKISNNLIESSTLDVKAKVVSLPPSKPAPPVKKYVTKRENIMNRVHGSVQALSYRDAHLARKAAAAAAQLKIENML